MKCLILNSIHLLRRNLIFYSAIWLVVLISHTLSYYEILFADANLHGFLILTTILLLPTASLESMGDANSARWDVFIKSLPVKKSLIVVSNYVLYQALSIVSLCLWIALPFEHGGTANFVDIIIFTHLTCIFYYPLTYLLNMKSSRGGAPSQLVLVVSYGIAFIGIILISSFVPYYSYILITAILLALYALSIMASTILDNLSRR